MLTRIRNANAVHKDTLVLPYSKMKHNLADILAREGYIGGVSTKQDKIKELVLKLKFDHTGEGIILGIKRVSKPGQRIYAQNSAIPKSNGGLGLTILSTSKGLMTDREARKQKFGGEVICQIW